eukprot:2482337-Prymnesium_polylepis.2
MASNLERAAGLSRESHTMRSASKQSACRCIMPQYPVPCSARLSTDATASCAGVWTAKSLSGWRDQDL